MSRTLPKPCQNTGSMIVTTCPLSASGGLVSQYLSRLCTVNKTATAHMCHLVPQKQRRWAGSSHLQVMHVAFYVGSLWPRHATPYVSPGRPGGPSGNLPSPIADLCWPPSQFPCAHTQFSLTRGHKSYTQSRHPHSLCRSEWHEWHVPPLDTAIRQRPTLTHGRGHLGRPCQRRKAAVPARATCPAPVRASPSWPVAPR